MDIEDYVNEPHNEGRNISVNRENSHSGLSKVILVVGISFCLLCIIQAVLNVTLRLHGDGFCNKSDLMDSAKVSLLEEHIKELQAENDRLIMKLSGKNQNCPQNWTEYMSSCYQLSAKQDRWWYAKDDCVKKGANLVIIDNEREEKALHALGDSVVWIGLKAEKLQGSWKWKWVDGRQLTYEKTIKHPTFEHGNPQTCVYSQQSPSGLVSWHHDVCSSELHWVCEKKIK